MIPIRDTVPAQRTAWIVRLLVCANLGAFVGELMHGRELEGVLSRFGVVPVHWSLGWSHALQWPMLLASLFTSQFLHGGFFHLGANMLYLWIFGDNVEDRLGHLRFLLLYAGSGAAAAIAQIFMEPSSSLPVIGASGAIAGVLGAYFLLFPMARIVTLVPWILSWQFIEVPAFAFLGLWFFLQWLQGIATIGDVANAGGVAWWAHVGGFVTGLVLLVFLRPRRRYF